MDPIRLPVEGPGGFRGALAHTAFRNIWFSQLAAQLADKFLLFSLIILAYNINGGSTSVAVTLLAYTVPAVLFARSVTDRKSTRLNSSHVSISYAVFCLKKKINTSHNETACY